MRSLRIIVVVGLVISLATPFAAPVAQAQVAPLVFNANYIIADDQMTDYLGMSASKIQEFLDTKPGVLGNYVHSDGRTAAQVIADAAQSYQISPKVLLTTIQKESSMITRSSFNTDGYSGSKQYYLDWITFYGWCDSCSTGVDKGFANQVSATAAAFRRYLDRMAQYGTSVSGWGPSISRSLLCIDSDYYSGRNICTPGTTITITPGNAATAALYTYTPHPGGNHGFWKIWNDYSFNVRRLYPDGTLLQAKGGKSIFLIQNGMKRKFATMSAFLSRYSPKRIIVVPADALAQYDTGKVIAFANYSVVQAPNRGIYLLVDDTKRPIKSKKAFQTAGFTKEEVVKASWKDLDNYTTGEPITTENIYPGGELLQHNKTGAIYFVKDGIRHPIISGAIYKSQFGNQKPIMTPGSKLAKYEKGSLIGFKDGDLVQSKTDTVVYFISNGYRLPIAGSAAARAFGFDKIWKSRIITDDKSIGVHPLGPTLDVDTGLVTLASGR